MNDRDLERAAHRYANENRWSKLSEASKIKEGFIAGAKWYEEEENLKEEAKGTEGVDANLK